jgi:hypothetical protein
MQVESNKAFKTGFVLKETDIRRIVDTIQDQFAKLSSGPKSTGGFTLKLRNGAILETSSLDEVLALENGGSSQITRLNYHHQTEREEPPKQPTIASIEFINADSDDATGYTSMRFHVHGDNRDWVFVTSSQLEERCERLRRFALNQLISKGPLAIVFRLVSPMIMLLALLGMMLSLGRSIDSRPQTSMLLEEAIKAGTVKEPIDAILFVERQRDTVKLTKDILPVKYLIFLVSLILILIGVSLFLIRYYPVYNFCWGEYADEFQRKETRRQFWLIIIIIGVVVSFLGSILANNVGVLKPWFGP